MQNENRSLSIVGCGWFGLPLAKEMLAGGWEVKGSTTSEAKLEQLYAMGIKPYLAQFPSKDDIGTELFDSAFLLINLPPGRRNPDVADTYPEAISQVVQTATRLGRTRKIVFVSSTSVYGHHHDLDYIDEATELMPETNAGKALWQAEQVVARCGIPAIILRFGGLAGRAGIREIFLPEKAAWTMDIKRSIFCTSTMP
ncbi:MAG: hypothetical protein HC819_15590 [Cyclobacteriaceae bacterium]|nr:hypothetical protein [Cyclobacteriaceae bacterium]